MADNVVEVVISGRDATGEAYTSAAAKEKAFADLTAKNSQQFQRQWDSNRRAVLRGHDALLMAARAEQDIDREARKLRAIEQEMSGGRGLLGRMLFGNSGGGWGSGGLSGMLTGGESGGGNIISSIGGSAGGLGWLGLGAAAGALSSELTALAGGFAAAGAGAGAFFALSHNAFSQLQSDVGKLQSGQQAVQLAQNMEKLYPSPAHLKALDAAREKLKALTMSMGQDAGPAAQAMQQMGDEWHKLQNQFAPTAFKVLGQGFTVIKDFMPALIPLAKAFAGALLPLLQQLDRFAKSKGFEDWLKKFTSLVGPATKAIGQGLGRTISDIGKLLTTFSGKDVAHAIAIAFDTLNGVIRGVTWTVNSLRTAWDWITQKAAPAVEHAIGNVGHAFSNIGHAISDVVNWFRQLPGRIERALANLPSMLFNIGKNIVMGLIHGLESMGGSLVHAAVNLGSSLWHSFTGLLGIHSPSTVFFEHGRNIVRGLVNGINTDAPRAAAAMRQLGLAGMPGGVGARGFGAAGGAPVIVLQLTGSGPFFEALKSEIRVRGGGGPNSVQVALGQNH